MIPNIAGKLKVPNGCREVGLVYYFVTLIQSKNTL